MQRKWVYLVITVLIATGFFAILIIASLETRWPGLLAQFNPQATEEVTLVPTATFSMDTVFPVFTATTSQSTHIELSTTPSSEITPFVLETDSTPDVSATPFAIIETTPASNHSFCERTGKTIVLTILLEKDDQENFVNLVSLRYLLFDFDNQALKSFSVPASLSFSGATLDSLNLPESTIDSVYTYVTQNIGQPGLDPDTIAANVTARVLFEQLGIVPDYFAILEKERFIRLLDRFEGLSVPASEQVLAQQVTLQNGQEAWAYLNPPETSFFKRQVLIDHLMTAVIAQLSDPSMLDQIPRLISSFQESAQTDLDRDTLLNLVCLAGNIPSEHIGIFTLNSGDLIETGSAYRLNSPEEIREWLMEEFIR